MIYRGNQPKPLKTRPGEPDDNIILNLAGLVVDAGVDALFGRDLKITAKDDTGDGTDEQATEFLDLLYSDAGMLTWQGAATNGAIAGHAAIRIVPAGENSRPGDPPRLLVVDPEMLRVVWAPDDIGRVLAYCLQWMTYDERGREVARRQIIEPNGAEWVIRDQESSAQSSARWRDLGESQWRYSWAPIVDAQNLPEPNNYYGRPDLTNDVVETQQALNRVMSNAARVQRIHGHPKVVAKGVGDGDLDVGPDEAIVLPDSESEVSLLEPRATVSDHLALFETVKSALHEISRVPEITAGKVENVGQLSGLALKILYGPLIRKTEVKRRLYGRMISEVSRRSAELAGYGPDVDAQVEWPEIIPDSPLDEAAAASALQAAGVSKATTLSQMGYDAEFEADQSRDENGNLGAAIMGAFDAGMTG